MTATDAAHAENGDWLVGNPTGLQLAAALWIGSVGLLILGLQPVLLGALYSEGHVTGDELALVATAEMIAIAIGSAIVAMLLPARNMRRKSAALLVLLALANFWTAYAMSSNTLIGARTLAGLAEGGLVAVATELIARSRRAERIGGYFVTLQTLAQCALALLLALYAVPAAGAAGGFVALGVVCLLSLVVAWIVPDDYADLPKDEHFANVLTLPAITALLSIFCYFMFFGAVWAFLEPLGAEFGIDGRTVGLMVSASLAAQVMGAMTATVFEARIDYRFAITVIGAIATISSVLLASGPGLLVFWSVAMVMGFILLFIVPYQIRLAITADETRNAVLLVPAAQLFGLAIGPVAASLLIDGQNFRPVPEFAAASALASVALLGVFVLVARRRVPA
ncbi:MFS transporter [Mesorhizobium sp. M1A.F.Ca.IN.020.06.1.1]|uniref:MFS transporter n=2 Tax=Mesorhizobium TaxID=68287 RepID=UPI000BB0C8B7|nr:MULTISPECIES: MFS transporter [unclassified Mesorhizobium]PBB32407.1 MFS transporter [Mesorhizobium sp. WSM3882]RUV04497.1 MFS transporter [Mesorhizobium sp. M1A.F.Ca.IN.020.03.2.1]RUV87850.1 MFS transporter [Mesorhizobium sp. M1A.F.Ca.IN.020.32.1.1]RUW07057.1 MFS transporter [Mesorhizobium sp. M1A.F.Ca.IN.022.05.2.1]RUW25625.1 MFS transporter [Mesorhizobium sp. M1A.F.Ca.IN.020.06.1.1]